MDNAKINQSLTAVILAGGIGSRLWPLSREYYPKQLLRLTGCYSLFQTTILRAVKHRVNKIRVIAAHQHRFYIQEQIDELALDASIEVQILLEPCKRNTAPAIALVSCACAEDELLWVMPADHVLEDPEFSSALSTAMELAAQGGIVTFGIRPTCPHEGYGYIQSGAPTTMSGAFKIQRFTEKPNALMAQAYCDSQDYYWNSGMFCFQAKIMQQEIRRLRSDIMQACEQAYLHHYKDLGFIKFPEDQFALCPEESIDYAVMEQTDRAFVVPLQGQWSDVGAWGSLYDLEKKDDQQNVIDGDVMLDNVNRSLVKSHSRLVAASGVDDLIIIETADAVLVANREDDQSIKQLIDKLKARDRQERLKPNRVLRPWGKYQVIRRFAHHEVRIVSVKPGNAIAPHQTKGVIKQWVLIEGQAEALVDNNRYTLTQQNPIFIRDNSNNSLYNIGQSLLEILEIRSDVMVESNVKRVEALIVG